MQWLDISETAAEKHLYTDCMIVAMQNDTDKAFWGQQDPTGCVSWSYIEKRMLHAIFLSVSFVNNKRSPPPYFVFGVPSSIHNYLFCKLFAFIERMTLFAPFIVFCHPFHTFPQLTHNQTDNDAQKKLCLSSWASWDLQTAMLKLMQIWSVLSVCQFGR